MSFAARPGFFGHAKASSLKRLSFDEFTRASGSIGYASACFPAVFAALPLPSLWLSHGAGQITSGIGGAGCRQLNNLDPGANALGIRKRELGIGSNVCSGDRIWV